VVSPGDLAKTRRAMRGLLVPGAHFAKEKDSRRRTVADSVARLPIRVNIYTCACVRLCESARQSCLSRLAEDLLVQGAQRMVLGTRNTLRGGDRDRHDRETIRAVLGERPSDTELVYEHMSSTSEELLWVADVAGWCWGMGGAWRRRISPIMATEVSVGKCALESAKPGRPPSGGKTGFTSPLHERSA
jgi:hypothetical protein